MEFYPAELTSPPVPLVALVGKPELHLSIGDFLRTQNVPRVHSIGIQDAHSAAGTFGEGRRLPLPPPLPPGAATSGCRQRSHGLLAHPCGMMRAGFKKVASSSSPPAGILKAGWLRKHRTARPAVAAVLVDREAGESETGRWHLRMAYFLLVDFVFRAVGQHAHRIVVCEAFRSHHGVPCLLQLWATLLPGPGW